MDKKDFFDEEYDKIEHKHASDQSQLINDWCGQQPAPSQPSGKRKTWYISLICLALVLCIVLGWVLCTVFSGTGSNKSQLGLFDEVLSYLDTKYYKEIPDEKMWAAMEDAGTAMLQSAGDRFSRLMSPSSYYEFCNPASEHESSNENGMFGLSFQFVEGIGIYVYDVVTDSSSYGKLQQSDIVVKITDIQTIDQSEMEDISTNAITQTQFTSLFENVKSATFHVLRDGAVFQCDIARGFTDYANPDYKFEFIEFYFGDGCTNISTSNMGTAATNTKEARKLGELSKLSDVGYIRIKEFSYIQVPNEPKPHTVVDEFKVAMDLFKSEIKDKNNVVIKKPLKYLILDLKGNPGGVVDYVTKIAGMLSTNSKLSAADRLKLDKGDKGYVMTTLVDRKGNIETHSAPLLYDNYFGALGDKPSIVVWTDGGSASASELLTGALRDYGTAVQMGVTTYGKGIAQTWKELKNYTGTFVVNGETVTYPWVIYYTTAIYRSPVTETNIHGIGYTPDEQYNGLDTYEKLWTATVNYFNAV